ncbi:MAG: hypothetical protein ACI3XM_05415 [Eubacteriales bacterium]
MLPQKTFPLHQKNERETAFAKHKEFPTIYDTFFLSFLQETTAKFTECLHIKQSFSGKIGKSGEKQQKTYL